jgi:kynurenine formamidase
MMETGQNQSFPGNMHYADDFISMPLQCSTQWDALAHLWYDDQIYNGYGAAEHVGPAGASRNSITALAKGVVGRGVLLDIARARGVDWLAPRELIHAAELEEAAASQGVEVGEGDILILRTGFWTKFLADRNDADYRDESCGIALDCCQYLFDHNVAALATDLYAVEAMPYEPGTVAPVHCVALRDMGMTFGEMFNLDELAADCVADGRWEFFFAGPPLKVTGAVGSPINPLAVK